jgi:hypothetical protein
VGLPGGDNYPLGGTPGFGFANFLVYFGFVSDLKDYFPFGVFYLLLVPLGLALVVRQLHMARAETALVTGSVALLASLYFSRVVHPNYLVLVATLLPLGAIVLGLAADAVVVPLALLALAVEVAQNEVFRATWDQAVAARFPELLTGALLPLRPLAGPGLTVDPVGLLWSATAAGLSLASLGAAVLGASTRVRSCIGLFAVAAVVVVPAAAVVQIGNRTGEPRAQDAWVVQAMADGAKIAGGRSPYSPPPSERPLGREAWSSSFRLDPPASLRPDHPLRPPGGSVLAAATSFVLGPDPRGLLLIGLSLLVLAGSWIAGGEAFPLALAVALPGPLALGTVFGGPGVLTLGLLAAVILAATFLQPTVAALLAGAAAAIDPWALTAAPIVVGAAARTGRGAGRRAAAAAVAGAAALVVPVVLLDPRSFTASLGLPLQIGPGFGLVDLLLYRGLAPSAGLAWVLAVLLVGTPILGAVALRHVRTEAHVVGLAALLSLAWLWLAPMASPDAVAVPIGLLALTAFAARRSLVPDERLEAI